MTGRLQVVFFHRRQTPDFSVRRLFGEVRKALPIWIEPRVAVSRFPSRGLWRRVYNIVEAVFRQGDVNHITGDVHYLVYLLCRKRTLLTILDLVTVHRLTGWRRAAFLFLWYRLPIRRAALVTVISEATRQDLLRHVAMDPDRVRVVHCPVPDTYRPSPKLFPETQPVLLMVGTRPNAGKNIERMAQAIQGLSCRIRVIGELDDSQRHALEQSGVTWTAAANISDEQMAEEYRRCDLLLFASTFEGFGLPIVEAQAIGRPVVTSRNQSMPEVAGDAACLVDPFDVASIRRGVMRVLTDAPYRESLVERGYRNVERFQPTRIAAQYARLYAELAGITQLTDDHA